MKQVSAIFSLYIGRWALLTKGGGGHVVVDWSATHRRKNRGSFLYCVKIQYLSGNGNFKYCISESFTIARKLVFSHK